MMGRKRNMSSQLRHRLTLQQEMQSPDGAGGTVKSWQDVADVWAEIIPLTGASLTLSRSSGKEEMVGAQTQAELSHRVRLRYRAGVTAAMRLAFESRLFNIRYVANVNEHDEMLELLVQEGVGI